ncbi:MAG: choice-of-anchor A family protein, partial [Vagococcus sp.]
MLKKKLSSLVSIVALLLSVLVVPLDVLAVESNKIVSSNYRDYNSIIFNDHTVHTADIEGSVAIGGDIITHGGFTYAGSYSNAHNIIGQGSLHEGTPGLVVAGNINYNSDSLVVVEGGNFIHTDLYQVSKKFNIDPNFSMINWSKEQMDALFNSFKADIANEMSLYKSMMTDQTEETIYHKKEAWVSQFDFYESKESDSVLFVDMSAESHDINDIYLPNLDAYDHVIIYSSQPSLKFSRGSIVYKGFPIDTGKPNNDVLFDMASKLTWVLPNATDLRIEGYGLIGDVYAPNASVDTKGGSLNGSLYAENLISAGGFEVHNFRNKPLIPEKTTEPTEPSTTEPSTTEPSTTEPSTTEPSTTEPSTTEPSTTEPSTTEPSTTEPSTTEPSTTEPSTTEPSTTEPSTTEPSTTEPSTTEP